MSRTEGPAGEMKKTPLVETVRDLHFDRRGGILTVKTEDRESLLYFHEGGLFHCKVEAPGERLDAKLIQWGLVEKEDMAALLGRAGGDLRGTLVREEVFPDAQAFDDFVLRLLSERMAEAFQPEGSFSFHEEDVSALCGAPFGVSTPNIALDGLRQMPKLSEIVEPLRLDDPMLTTNPSPTVRVESLRFGPSEGYVYSMFTGATSLTDIVRTSPLEEADTLALAYGLLALDVLRHPGFQGYRFSMSLLARRSAKADHVDEEARVKIEAEYQRIRSIDIFQLLPGTAVEDAEGWSAAVETYQAAWATSNFSARVAKEFREQLQLIAGRAGEALLAGMDSRRTDAPGQKAEGGYQLTRMEFSKSASQSVVDDKKGEAQAYHQHALDAFRAKDYHSAVQYAREAIRRDPSRVSYHELLGDSLIMNPHWRQKAEEAYRHALKIDEFNPDLVVKIGLIYAGSGLITRAKSAFERALELHKDHEGAKAALKDLRKRR